MTAGSQRSSYHRIHRESPYKLVSFSLRSRRGLGLLCGFVSLPHIPAKAEHQEADSIPLWSNLVPVRSK
jgi:hypothetical protein